MVWVKLDDHMDEHHKIAALSDAAFRLWASGLCYANRSLTDGFIPTNMLGRLYSGTKVKTLAAELVRQRLWHIVDGGWQIHDYLEYQPSKDKVTAERKATRQRVDEWRKRQKGDEKPVGNGVGNGVTDPATNRRVTPAPSPVPFPDPVPPESSPRKSAPFPSEQVENEGGCQMAAEFQPDSFSPSLESYEWTNLRESQYLIACAALAKAMGQERYPPDPDLQRVARSDWADVIGDQADSKAATFAKQVVSRAVQKGISIIGHPRQDFETIVQPALVK